MARADRRRAQRAQPAAATRRSDVVIEDTMFFPQASQACEVDVPVPRARVRARLRRLRRRRRRRRHRRRLPRRAGGIGRPVDLGLRAAGARQPEGRRRRSGTSRPRSRPQGNIDEARSRRSRATSPSGPRTRTRSASSQRCTCRRRRPRRSARRSIRCAPTYLAPGDLRDTIFQLGGSPLKPDPITNAVSTSYEREISAGSVGDPGASAQAVETYRKIAEIQPTDPTVQLELAQAAQSANDTATVIAAYEAFLKLAPDDPTAPRFAGSSSSYKQCSPERLHASRVDSPAVRPAVTRRSPSARPPLRSRSRAAARAAIRARAARAPESSSSSRPAAAATRSPTREPGHDRAQPRRRVRAGPRRRHDVGDVHAGRREQIRYPITDTSTGAPGMPGVDQTLPLCEDVEGDAFCVDDQEQAVGDIAAYVGAVAGTGVTAEARRTGSRSSPRTAARATRWPTRARRGRSGRTSTRRSRRRSLVVDRVTNGQGGMPSFKDSLDADQIQAVADYVSSAAGK